MSNSVTLWSAACQVPLSSVISWSLRKFRSPEEGNGNPLQYSCLENSVDRGAWRATVYGVAKSQTWLAFVNNASINMEVQISLWDNGFITFGYIARRDCWILRQFFFVNSWGTHILFPIMAIPVYILTKGIQSKL